jgi:Arc/MetJ-type ribon-helix-helix transcriptional regulator
LYYTFSMMASHLTLRLGSQDAELLESLRSRMGLSKSELVKQALRALAASQDQALAAGQGLYALGEQRFGRHGDASRQSAEVKSVVRERLRTKRKA